MKVGMLRLKIVRPGGNWPRSTNFSRSLRSLPSVASSGFQPELFPALCHG